MDDPRDDNAPAADDSRGAKTKTDSNSQDYSAVPREMRQAKRWLVWRSVPRPDGGKPRKVPYYVDDNKRAGALDTPADYARLASMDDALRVLGSGKYTGLGFALGREPGSGLYWQAGDLDHLSEHPELHDLLDGPGYRETSPSGDGLRIIGRGRQFEALASNASGVEAYCERRYVTVTGVDGRGTLTDLHDLVTETLTPRHHAARPEAAAPAQATVDPGVLRDLRSALAALRSDDRDLWIKMGHALKTLGEPGRALWIEWSQASTKYDPEDSMRVWESLRPSRTGYQAVFAAAARAGWINPLSVDARIEFAEIESSDPAANDPLDLEQRRVPVTDLGTAELTPPIMRVDPILPGGAVTLLGAHGGAGKSTLALQLAAHVALGREWAGLPVAQCPVLYLSAEDPGHVVRWRLQRICRAEGIDPADLSDLTVLDTAEMLSAALYGRVADPMTGRADYGVTALYGRLRRYCRAHRIGLLVLDNASDLFDANEIERARVRGFMRSLARLVGREGAVLLLVHVDKLSAKIGAGKRAANDEDYSGSTAWHNSARSRLSLSRDKQGQLVLRHAKANLSRRLPVPILFAWPDDGVPMPVNADDDDDLPTADYDTRMVLRLIAEYEQRGEWIASAPTSRANAYAMLEKAADYPGLPKSDLFELLREAQRAGYLAVASYRVDYKQRERWTLTDAGRQLVAEGFGRRAAGAGTDAERAAVSAAAEFAGMESDYAA